jgi:predicted CXXCH cytochrome family protein
MAGLLSRRTIAWLGVILLLAAACGAGRTMARGVERRADSMTVSSNVLRSDYAGSRACETCHAEIYQAWLSSPMHRMTRIPEQTEVRAPFDGGVFHFKDDALTMDRRGARRFVSIHSRSFGDHLYLVTKVIGGRYREDFAGVEVESMKPDARIVSDPNAELVLPVTYVFSPPSFRLKGYSVMVGERPGFKAGGVWNQTCIFCHNTVPGFSSLLGELYGPRAPSYQGVAVDRLLPGSRRASLAIRDAAGLERAATAEAEYLAPGGGAGDGSGDHLSGVLAGAIRTTRERFNASHFVELGIGCESCHGGSREHVAQVARRPTFETKSPLFDVRLSAWDEKHRTPDRIRVINRTCARCHQVLFSRYPFTWEGGERMDGPGGSHISSGEARDFLLGGCTTALSCTSCHDPHAADSKERLEGLAGAAGNELCSKCHARYRGAEAVRAHTHHDPNGEGAVCINCHMPKKNMGLGYNLSRYHRIGSPTEKARVERDRPLECALCHADKTVESLVSAMERFWNKSFDRERLRSLYGDLSAPVLEATVTAGKAHEQATAMYALGEHRVKSATQLVAGQLLNRYPLVRYFARQALEKMAGRPCDVDLDQDDAKIEAEARRWLERSGLPPGGSTVRQLLPRPAPSPKDDAIED